MPFNICKKPCYSISIWSLTDELAMENTNYFSDIFLKGGVKLQTFKDALSIAHTQNTLTEKHNVYVCKRIRTREERLYFITWAFLSYCKHFCSTALVPEIVLISAHYYSGGYKPKVGKNDLELNFPPAHLDCRSLSRKSWDKLINHADELLLINCNSQEQKKSNGSVGS